MALDGVLPVGGVSDWIQIGQLGPGPLNLILNSSAGGRKIECSLMGTTNPTDGRTVTPDQTIATQICVVTNSSVGAVRFTGAQGDSWKVG